MTFLRRQGEFPDSPCLLPAASFSLPMGGGEVQVSVDGADYGVFLCDESGVALFRLLQPLLDGSHTVSQISELGQRAAFSEHEIQEMLQELHNQRLIIPLKHDLDGQRSGSVNLCDWRWHASFPGGKVAAHGGLTASRVGLICSDPLGAQLAESLLDVGPKTLVLSAPKECAEVFERVASRSTAIALWTTAMTETIDEMCECSDFLFVAVSGNHLLDPHLNELNEFLFSRGKPSFLLRTAGWRALLGPLCIPDAGTCCFAETLGNEIFPVAPDMTNLLQFGAPTGPTSFFSSIARFATAIAGDSLMPERQRRLINRIWVADWAETEVRSVRLLKNPRCSVCGRLANRMPEGRSVDE